MEPSKESTTPSDEGVVETSQPNTQTPEQAPIIISPPTNAETPPTAPVTPNISSNPTKVTPESAPSSIGQTPVTDSAPQPPAVNPVTVGNMNPVGQTPMSNSQMSSNKSGKNPFKNFSAITIGLAIFGIFAFASAGAYFGYILPNKPENIWKTSLNRSSKLFEKIISIDEGQDLKGYSIKGSVALSSELMSADMNIDFKTYESEGQGTMDIGASGQRINFEFKGLDVENSDAPDIYMKVNGIKGLGSFFGEDVGNRVDALDSQWLVIDHTLFEQYTKEYAKNFTQEEQVSEEEAREIIKKISVVNNEYLFTTDEQKAVFNVVENVGKEEYEGKNSYKFKVSVNKEHLKAYTEQLKTALQDTKLQKLLGEEYDSFFDEAIKEIENINESDTAEVWVDMSTKLIRNVRFTNEQDKGEYVDVSLLYEGGDEFPLRIKGVSDDGEAAFTFAVNTKDQSAEIKIDAKSNDGTAYTVKGSIKVSPNNEPLNVQKPEGALSLIEVMGTIYEAYNQSMTGQYDSQLYDEGQSYTPTPLFEGVLNGFEL